MDKKINTKDLILKILEEGSKSQKELREKISESKKEGISNAALKENLLNLLHENRIILKGINWNVHDEKRYRNRKSSHPEFARQTTKGQTFYPDSFIYELAEKLDDDIRIRSLISDLIEGEYEKQLKAEADLLLSFQNKIEKIIAQRMEEWGIYDKKLRYVNVPDNVLLWLVGEEKLENKLKSVKMVVTLGEYDEGELKHVQLNDYVLPGLRNEFSHKKFRFLEGEKIEDNIPFENSKKDIFIRMHLIDNLGVNNKEITKRNEKFSINEYLNDKQFETANLQPFTNEEFLERKLGFSKPKIRNMDEIENLFKEIVKFIRFRDVDKSIYIEKFSYALSNDNNAEKYLDEIIKEATNRESL